MTGLLKGKSDVLSLGQVLTVIFPSVFCFLTGLTCFQGIVYWPPPEKALRTVQECAVDPKFHGYGADDGTVELRAALVEKVGFFL